MSAERPLIRRGYKSGRLTVIKSVGKLRIQRHIFFLCRCTCGKIKTVRSDHLSKRSVRSCGCLSLERIKSLNLKHGMSKTPEYMVWKRIKSRCFHKKHEHYARYGGRGIRVCGRWRKSFTLFLKDVGVRPSGDHWIGRIDNNGHYEPGNVRWESREEQANNRASNVMLIFNGVTRTLTQFARQYGFRDPRVVWSRIFKHGWSVENALTTRLNKIPLSLGSPRRKR